MDVNKIQEQIKDNMAELIKTINSDNLIENKEQLLKHFDLLENLHSIKVLRNNNFEDSEGGKTNNDNVTIKKEIEQIEEQKGYPLIRSLKGGRLDGIGIYVPESIIRKKSFEEGDLIHAEPSATDKTKFYYKLIKKRQGSITNESKRIQVSYCILKEENSYLLATEYLLNGERKLIKYDDAPHTFLISKEMSEKEGLESGDLVDIAYNSENVNEFQVVWKHQTNIQKHSNPLPSSYYKEKTQGISESSEYKSVSLKGKKILLLAKHISREFSQVVERMGGEFIHANGNEQTKRIESMVKNCDLLITMTPYIDHSSAEKARDFAKTYGKKFVFMESRGISNFIDKIKVNINH
ncbi:DUF2325 domain-containing protein [Bacillus safensis]|uniref:DUF2325 domain-containing protein n=1 Tax=Bacillus safensis TaxID=561879 RepID=A0A1L6ZPA8_BACIA|nr:DUF2325 domain-containing protein [Bacillus safensis]APT48356.1 hypothetical protein BSA145_21060 [Bacillus safensis]